MITTFHDLRKEELVLAEKRICKKIAKKLNIDKLVIEGFNVKNYHIEINDISIDLSIDQYNNIVLTDTPIIEIPLLKALHILCNHYLEYRDSYHFRSGTSLFISYIDKYRNQIRESDIVEMCRIDDQDNEHGCFCGLTCWLLGNDILKPILGDMYNVYYGNGYYNMSPSLIALLLDYVKTNRSQYKNRIEYTTIQNGELQ